MKVKIEKPPDLSAFKPGTLVLYQFKDNPPKWGRVSYASTHFVGVKFDHVCARHGWDEAPTDVCYPEQLTVIKEKEPRHDY